MRPRNNNNGRNNNNNNNGGKRINPRVQTFDSNGPDVRVRGTAYQISDKYLSLAKDAAAAGDAILAESYLQHAEHYQRFIAEMTERFEQFRPQHENRDGQEASNEEDATEEASEDDEDSTEEPLEDLDQAFLVGDISPKEEKGNVATNEEEKVVVKKRVLPRRTKKVEESAEVEA